MSTSVLKSTEKIKSSELSHVLENVDLKFSIFPCFMSLPHHNIFYINLGKYMGGGSNMRMCGFNLTSDLMKSVVNSRLYNLYQTLLPT